MLKRLWTDESGMVISSELVLVSSTLVLGMVAGMQTVRDGIVAEFANVAEAIAVTSQSYEYSGVSGHAAQTDGARFQDAVDLGDNGQTAGSTASACVVVGVPPSGEGQQ